MNKEPYIRNLQQESYSVLLTAMTLFSASQTARLTEVFSQLCIRRLALLTLSQILPP